MKEIVVESLPEASILGGGGEVAPPPPMKILGWQTYRFAPPPPNNFDRLDKFIICNAGADLGFKKRGGGHNTVFFGPSKVAQVPKKLMWGGGGDSDTFFSERHQRR